MPFQIKELTNSYVAVGALGLIGIAPLIVFGLYGGALADAFDRRRMAIVTEIGLGICVLILAINAMTARPQVWVLYVVTILVACLDGLQRPSLDAITPRIVAKDDLAAASALGSLTGQGTVVLGTAIGGLIVVNFGITSAYIIDCVSYAISVAFVMTLPAIHPTTPLDRANFSAIIDGARYAWSRKDLLGTYLVDTAAMIFAFPNALFPFLADDLHQPSSLGLLYGAGAVGALIAAATSGWTAKINRQGVAIAIAAMVWGLGITCVGLTHSMPLVLVAIAVAGGADMLSAQFRHIMWNSTIPDHVRGRMAGIELLSYSIGPNLGEARAGISAHYFGLQRAFVSGGVLCVASVVACTQAMPKFRRFDTRTSEHVQNK